jgi:hypothetical protein
MMFIGEGKAKVAQHVRQHKPAGRESTILVIRTGAPPDRAGRLRKVTFKIMEK